MTTEQGSMELQRSRREVLEAFAAVGADIERRPADGGWNAWEIAYHLLDMERWYIAKLCEAVAPDRPAALACFLQVWSRLRDEALTLVGAIPTDRLDTSSLLSGVPDWTPRALLAAMATHDREHAAQVLALSLSR